MESQRVRTLHSSTRQNRPIVVDQTNSKNGKVSIPIKAVMRASFKPLCKSMYMSFMTPDYGENSGLTVSAFLAKLATESEEGKS